MRRLIVFDIDGTLHKTEIISLKAFEIVMAEYGLEIPTQEIIFSTFGMGQSEFLEALEISTSGIDTRIFLKRFEQEEIKQIQSIGELYPGVYETLVKLRNDGILLGLCSMCSCMYMQAFLDRFQMHDMFSYLEYEIPCKDKSELLKNILYECNPDRAIMVGDRKYDVEAATKAGIDFIGCLYGYGNTELNNLEYVCRLSHDLYNVILSLMDT